MLVMLGGSLLLTALLGVAAYRSALALKRGEVSVNLLLAPGENAVRLLLIGLCVLIGWASSVTPEALGWRTGEVIGEGLTGLIAGLGLLVVVNLGSAWAVRRFGPGIYSPLVLRNMLPRSQRDWLLSPLALAPAVLLEELLFRSLLTGGFASLIPFWAALAFSSAAFGVMHLPQGTLGVVIAAILGTALGALLLWRGSILTPFVAHYVLNLAQLVVASVMGEPKLDSA